jgi:hypothetical protein
MDCSASQEPEKDARRRLLQDPYKRVRLPLALAREMNDDTQVIHARSPT